MAWYNNIFGAKPVEVEEKLNPAQFHMGGTTLLHMSLALAMKRLMKT